MKQIVRKHIKSKSNIQKSDSYFEFKKCRGCVDLNSLEILSNKSVGYRTRDSSVKVEHTQVKRFFFHYSVLVHWNFGQILKLSGNTVSSKNKISELFQADYQPLSPKGYLHSPVSKQLIQVRENIDNFQVKSILNSKLIGRHFTSKRK